MRSIKPVVMLLFILCRYVSQAQMPMDAETGKFKYEEVVQAGGLSAEELFSRAKQWMTSTFIAKGDSVFTEKEGNSVNAFGNLYFESKIAGLAVSGNSNRLMLNMKIWTKEGRYKYRITDFIYNYYIGGIKQKVSHLEHPLEEIKYLAKKKQKLYGEIDQKMKELISGLEKTVEYEPEKPNENDDDDW